MAGSRQRAETSGTRYVWLRAWVLAGLIAGSVACGKSPDQGVDAARAAMAEKDYATAVVELKNVLQESPDNREARVLLARSSLVLGDAPTAEKELERAYELGADPAAQRALHYRIQLALGHAEEVSISLEQDAGADGLTPAEAATFKGEALLGLRRFKSAESSFRRALDADPGYGEARVGLAQALLAQNRRDEAGVVLDETIATHPELPGGWLLRGRIKVQAGELEAARDDLQEAVAAARALPDRNREFVTLASLAETQLGLNDIAGAEESVKALKRIAGGAPITRKIAARLHFAKKEYPEARAQLQSVLNVNPDDAAALFLLGAVYLTEGDPAQAEIHLVRAVRLAPDNLAARQLLAQAQLRNARPDSAVEALAPLLESGNQVDAQTSYLASQALLRSGATVEAIELLEQSYAADPDDMQVAMNLGAAYLSARRIDDAVALFESLPESDDYRRDLLLALSYAARDDTEQAQARIDRIVAENPDDVGALLLVAEYYLATGQLGQARTYLERAGEIEPDNADVRLRRARVALIEGDFAIGREHLEALLADNPDNASMLVALGEIATREGRVEDAIDLFERATEADSRAAMPWAALARARVLAGDVPGAEAAATTATERDPDNPLALLAMGEATFAAGRYREASGYFAQAVARQPDMAIGWHRQARAQLALGERGAARESLDRALEIQPGLFEAQVQLALLASSEGDTDSALTIARALRTEHPGLAAPEVLEGEILFRAEQYAEAAAAFERGYAKQPSGQIAIRAFQAHVQAGESSTALLEAWLAEHPDDDRVRIVLAEQRTLTGDKATAIDEYERALETNADNPVALNNMAYLLQQQGDPRAEEFARRAHELRPDIPQIKDTLGWILVGNGQVDEGRALLEAAHAAAPGEGEIAYHLAVALEKSGERAKSEALLRAALAAERPFESRADAERLLGEISGR